jgi:hypothetical protein
VYEGLQWGAGIALVLFGLMHFVSREHDPDHRSYYTGGIHFGHRARVFMALAEMAFGAFLLLTRV